MENTSAAASVSFVALSRLADDHAAGFGGAAEGTGLSSSWTGTGLPSTGAVSSTVADLSRGNGGMRRVRTAPEHNYIDLPAMTPVAAASAAAKQGAPPRGEPR